MLSSPTPLPDAPLNSLLVSVLPALMTLSLWGPFLDQAKYLTLLGSNLRFLFSPPRSQSTQHFNLYKLLLFYGAMAFNLHFRALSVCPLWNKTQKTIPTKKKKKNPDSTSNKLKAQEALQCMRRCSTALLASPPRFFPREQTMGYGFFSGIATIGCTDLVTITKEIPCSPPA